MARNELSIVVGEKGGAWILKNEEKQCFNLLLRQKVNTL